MSQVSYRQVGGGKWDYRVTFSDASCTYRLKVTDLTFCLYLDWQRMCCRADPGTAAFRALRALSRREVYFRIGLARHWPKSPGRRYLQIDGIYSLPDYLDGKCFANFATALGRAPATGSVIPNPDDLDDLPL